MNSNHVEPISDLRSLPFVTGESNTPSNSGLPDVLPFSVGVRPDIGLIAQVPNPEVEHYLELAYRRGSIIGTPMSAEGIGRRYADDFVDFVSRALAPRTVKGLRVLEIGCGTGYLLYRLKELGAEVLGVEPGEQGQVGARSYGIEIIHGMFPNDQIPLKERFDVIVTYGVVEHVVDPIHFLEAQARYLTESGVVILSVPDCSECIATGDVSMFLHEHWNYFSPCSLSRLVKRVGLHLLRLESSGYGGALYAVAGKTGESIYVESAGDEAALFEVRMHKGIENARQFFGAATLAKSSLGIFCAARAINLLHLLEHKNSVRFFDDDVRLHGKYYPPFDIIIESRAALLSDPVDELVIMSRVFGKDLSAELSLEVALSETHIAFTEEVLGN